MLTPPRAARASGSVRAVLAAVRRGLGQLTERGSWWRELLLIGVLYGAYELSRGLGEIDVPSAIANGREILHVEQVWHLSPERVLNQALERAEVLAVAASYFYSIMHYVVTPVVLVWMYRKHRGAYGPARTALAISTALGLVVYLLLPTAPPRLLAGSGLRDTLADTQNWGWWGGEGSVPRGLGELANQFAAMPSLHVGWALWCGALIAIYARRRWVKLLGICYPVATTIVVMATGNHYLLDAIAGALTMAAGALLTAALPRRAVAPESEAEPEAAPHVLAEPPDPFEVLLTDHTVAAVRAAAAASAARVGVARARRDSEPQIVPADSRLCRVPR
jgi:membrane-associated phospholipid phosphatase